MIRRTVKVTRNVVEGQPSLEAGSTDIQDLFAQARARRVSRATESATSTDLDPDDSDDAEAKAEFGRKVDEGMKGITTKHNLFSSSRSKPANWDWDNIS